MLNQTDQILIDHLFAYARFTTKQLAQITNLSQSTIVYRLQRLEQQKAILKYDAIINWDKLPFLKVIYLAKLTKIESILKQQEVFAVFETIGSCNYFIWCFFKTKEQQKSFEKLLGEYQHLEVKKITIPQLSFFDQEIQLKIPPIKDQKLDLTKEDIAIMKYLADGGARTPLLQISKDLNLSYDVVNYRFKKLYQAGYFYRLCAQPGDSGLGIQTASLLLTLKEDIDIKPLSNHFILIFQGRKKVLVQIYSRDFEDLKKQIKLLTDKHLNDIISIETLFLSKPILLNRYPLEWLLE